MRKLTIFEFIEKANLKHNYCYNYGKSTYVNSKFKIEIICKKHGSFFQKPNDHLNGVGCPICGKNKSKENRKKGLQLLLETFNKVHFGKYKYDDLNYENNKSKITIECPIHGKFKQSIIHHIGGSGCKKCVNKYSPNSEEFVKKAQQIHGQKYDYQLVDYKNAHTKVKIICPEHGIFEQNPHEHIKGQNCKKCSNSGISKPEIEVQDFVKSLGFKIITNNRKILNGKELDIYIPELNKAIEFNGFYWHYDKTNPNCKPSCYHSTKSKLCKSKDINLLHLREDLWNRNKQKMKKVIHKFLEYEI